MKCKERLFVIGAVTFVIPEAEADAVCPVIFYLESEQETPKIFLASHFSCQKTPQKIRTDVRPLGWPSISRFDKTLEHRKSIQFESKAIMKGSCINSGWVEHV